MTSTQWVEYHVGTKRKSYNTQPTSNITAEAVTVDGFTLSQKDNAGVTATHSRSYTANGMIQTRTDGRGNTTTTVTDKAGRVLTVTDAMGNVTTTTYDSSHDLPATVTDAKGNTSCYRYDARGRKVAEWGTGVQPVMFGYDDADRMVTLTTFRAGTETVSTDPSNRTDGDTTTWSYHNASGMETAKTYADGSNVCKIYDAYNRVLTETDARGKVKAHTYEPARGLLLGTTYSDSTTPRAYTYNHLGQRTQVTDAAGVRTLSYNSYGEQESDSLVADSVTHLITETRDEKGRSTGYTYAKNGSVQQTVTTGYGSDGRIAADGKSGMVNTVPACERVVLYGEVSYINDMVRNNPSIEVNGLRSRGANPGRQGAGVKAGANIRIGERWSANANYSFNAMDDSNEHVLNIGASRTF